MKVRTKAAMTIAAAGVLGSVVMAGPAYAGSDGQQINFCGVSDYSSVQYSGYNQSGQQINGSEILAPNACDNSLPGYWWVGTVSIAWYDANGTYITTNQCVIPKKQSSDWYNCYV